MQSPSSMFHIYTVLREGHKFTKLHFTFEHKKQHGNGNISSVSTKNVLRKNQFKCKDIEFIWF